MTNGDFEFLLEYLGVTASDMAAMLGVSRQSVQGWKSGKTPAPAWLRIVLAHMIRQKAGIDLKIASSILAIPLRPIDNQTHQEPQK